MGDTQIVGTDPRDGADGAAQHVVEAAELAGAFDRRDVFGVFDHADQGRIATRVATDRAAVLLGDVAAYLAELHLVADLSEQRRQARYIERRRLQDVECDALSRLRADARKAAELVDQVLDDAVVHQVNLVGGS
ncbi:hypothetical protein QE418_000757 [Microbacterium testaceum]|nr:hypothetical protein [Microbacterium testaceum]